MSPYELVPHWMAAPAERAWSDIPAVVLIGVVVGIVFLIAAIRGMFGNNKKK
jgi:hypothetical protein